jgi:hypothetical protein
MKKDTYIMLLASLLVVAPIAQAHYCNSNIPLARPDTHYTDNHDGTVTDNTTGLMWKQCSEGVSTSNTACDTGSSNTYTWQGALAQAQNVNTGGFAGYSDWRLPNIKELGSLVETACGNPSINVNFFPEPTGAYFWSSTPDPSDSTLAWRIYFDIGGDSRFGKGNTHAVRLVRSGG